MSIGIIEQVVRAATSARSTKVNYWPEGLLSRIAYTAGRSDVIRLRCDSLAASLCEAIQVPAFETRGAIWAHPILLSRLDDPDCSRILAHEAAHVFQRGSAASAGPVCCDLSAESEADNFASALLAGQTFPIAPRKGLPALQPAIPLLIILLVAGLGLTAGGIVISQRRRDEREAEGLPAEHRDPHLHETWAGMIPFVGSVDQLFNGENWAMKAGGGVFLILDLTLVGGLLAKGVVKGSLVFMTRAAVREGLAEVARGGGTALQKEAYVQLTEAVAREEMALGSKQAIQAAVMKQLLSSPGPKLVVGSTGWLNHSVAYYVVGGEIYKLHGGILRTAYPVASRAIAEVVTDGWVRNFNRMTVFAGEQALSDAALRWEIDYWGNLSKGWNPALNILLAQGCSNSQAIMLERLGLYTAGLRERLVPYLLDRGVASVGRPFVINPLRAGVGTGIQTSLYLTAGGAYEFPAMLRMLNARAAGVYFSHNLERNEVQVMVVESVDRLPDLDANISQLAGAQILFPSSMTFRDRDTNAVRATVVGSSQVSAPTRVGSQKRPQPRPTPGRLPDGGGLILNRLPDGGRLILHNSDEGFPIFPDEASSPPPGVIWDSEKNVCRPAGPEDDILTIPPLR